MIAFCTECKGSVKDPLAKDYCQGHWIGRNKMEPLIRNKGKVINGSLVVYDKDLYEYTMSEHEGKNVDILIEETKEGISDDQHGYYRGGVLPTAGKSEQFGGWLPSEIHSYFVRKHLTNVVVRILNGKEYEVPVIQSTANIGKRRMASFIDKVIMELDEMGIKVLSPEEYNLKRNKTKTYGS